MSADLRHLERMVEREMRLLDALRTPAPPADAIAHLTAAVVAEARRGLPQRLSWRRVCVVAAAAVALVLALRGSAPATGPADAGGSAAAAFDAWVTAVDEGGRLLDAPLRSDAEGGNGALEFERALEGLERSFRIGT